MLHNNLKHKHECKDPAPQDDYYPFVVGEKIDSRYWVHSALGRGSFGIVLRTYDCKERVDVALKIIRKSATYHKQGVNEVNVLKMIQKYNGNNKFPIIMYKRYFYWNDYLCIVFPLYSDNLYLIIKKNRHVGFGLETTRKIVKQLLECLFFFQHPRVSVIHCDLKPENILLRNIKSTSIKLIDFGSSTSQGGGLFRYIQSRYYRSPEVVLEIGYSYPIDMWSLGCIMTELHTGRPIFPSKDETDHMYKIVELLGIPPKRMVEKSQKRKMFFAKNEFGNYELIKNIKEMRYFVIPNSRTIPSALSVDLGHRVTAEELEKEDYSNYFDLISRMLCIDPDCRITPLEALRHPFIKSTDAYDYAVDAEEEQSDMNLLRRSIVNLSAASDENIVNYDQHYGSADERPGIKLTKPKRIASQFEKNKNEEGANLESSRFANHYHKDFHAGPLRIEEDDKIK